MFNVLMTIAQDSVRQLSGLQQSQTRLLQALVPTADDLTGHTHTALSPLIRLTSYQNLLGKAITRQVLNCQGLWALALQPEKQNTALTESFKMQGAIFERLAAQQAQWNQGLEELARLVAGVRDVNTLSKLMEQEYNVQARLGGLLNDQATALMELMESIQIGYGYLLAQQEEPAAD